MLRWETKTIAPPDYYVRLRDIQISLGLELKQMGNLICIPEVTYLYYERANTIEMSLETLIQFAVKAWRLT